MEEIAGRKHRILFVGEGVTLTHVLRPLELAKSLDTARHEAHLACDPCYRECVSRAGIRWHPLASISPAAFRRRLLSGSPVYREAELRGYVEAELRLLDELKPEVVVGDFRLTLSISCELRAIPYLVLAHAHWSPQAARRHPAPDLPMTRWLGARATSMAIEAGWPLISRLHARRFNRVRRDYGLSPLGGLEDMYTHGTMTLYLDLPELEPLKVLPPGHVYLGPMYVEPAAERPTWWGRWDADRPVVFLSPGSSGNVGAFRAAVRELGRMDVTQLVATSGLWDESELPANAYASAYLPGLAAAEAAAVVVCNGGSGAVYQALKAGRPLVCVPENMDQHFIAERVAATGAGILLRSEKVRGFDVASAVSRLLTEDEPRKKARGLSRLMSQWDAVKGFGMVLAHVGAGSSALVPRVADAVRDEPGVPRSAGLTRLWQRLWLRPRPESAIDGY